MKISRTSLATIASAAVITGAFFKIAGNEGRETKPAPPPVPTAIQEILSQKGGQNGKSQSFLYEAARHDLALQEQWINRVLAKYGSQQNLPADVVIITPQNAAFYNYDLAKPPSHTQLFLTSGAFKIEDFGTQKVPAPMLYLPSDFFVKTRESDLEALIAFHMAEHVRALRNGFDFGSIEMFRTKDNTNSYSLPMLDAVLELNALYKDQSEKGSKPISAKYLEGQRELYMSRYIQLWMHSPSIKEDVADMLKARYFQPWMINSNSIWVSEDVHERDGVPEKWIMYGGKLDKPFIVAEAHNGKPVYMIQAQIQKGQVYDTIKLPLPKGLP